MEDHIIETQNSAKAIIISHESDYPVVYKRTSNQSELTEFGSSLSNTNKSSWLTPFTCSTPHATNHGIKQMFLDLFSSILDAFGRYKLQHFA